MSIQQRRPATGSIASATPGIWARPAALLRPFIVNIGQRGSPRLSFACMALSSADAFNQHVDLGEVGERVEVEAVHTESFDIRAARHQLAQARLQACGSAS